MLVRQITARFEFELSPEIIKEAAASGTAFRCQIQMPEVLETEKEGVIRGLPGQAVYLEKFNDALIKLFITVYKPERSDICAASQTDVQTNKTRPTQTDIKLLSDNESQTFIKTFEESEIQTDIKNYVESDIQTDKSPSKNMRVQTETKSGTTVDTQTDIREYMDTFMQTDKAKVHGTHTQTHTQEYKECEIQTDTNKMKNGSAQTVIKEYTECDMQTDIKEYTEVVSQTREKRVREERCSVLCETDCNLATQADSCVMTEIDRKEAEIQVCAELSHAHIQTVATDVTETAIQAVAESLQHMCQTDISMALQSDGSVQATEIMLDNITQTNILEYVETDIQTDIHEYIEANIQTDIHEYTERDIQTDIHEYVETDIQTDIHEYTEALIQTDTSENETRECQTSESRVREERCSVLCETDCNLAAQADGSVMTEIDRKETEIQVSTDLSHAHIQTHAASVTDSATQNESQTPSVATEGEKKPIEGTVQGGVTASATASYASVTSNISQDTDNTLNTTDNNFDASFLCASFSDVMTPVKQPLVPIISTRENMAQTDPVTIIIGDASFLLKKLKGSASSPSKVTTTGNEIEIEVSVDQGEPPQPPPPSLPPPTQPQQVRYTAASHAGPQVRAVAQYQPVVRGAVPAGPRVRMPVVRQPVSIQQQQLQQRQQLHQQQKQQIAAAGPAGPVHVMGGNFSCPFCSYTFIDSPALYEHLSISHANDQKDNWRQPKGRQGKTIIPKSQAAPPTPSPETSAKRRGRPASTNGTSRGGRGGSSSPPAKRANLS